MELNGIIKATLFITVIILISFNVYAVNKNVIIEGSLIKMLGEDEYVEHIERIVDVNTDIAIEDKLAKVNLLWRQK